MTANPFGDARFRALVQHAADMVLVVQRDGTIAYVSPAVERLLGYRPDELIGTDAGLFGHPDDILLTAEADGGLPLPSPHLFRTRHADGTWRHIEVVFSDLTRDAAVGGIVLNARDVTERIAAERTNRQLAQIVSSMPDAILAVDLDGLLTSWNDGAERMFGWARAEVLGQRPDFLSPRGHMTASAKALDLALRGTSSSYETDARRRDGSVIDVTITIFPLSDSSGAVVGVSGIVRDISPRRVAERELLVRSEQQAAVVALGERALAGASVDDLLQAAADQIAITLGVALVNVFEMVPSGDAVVLRGAHGGARGPTGVHRQALEPGSWLAFVLEGPGPVTTPDLRRERRFHVDDAAVQAGLVSGISTRLDGREGPVGAIATVDNGPRTFSHDDAVFLQSVANVLSAAIERSRVTEEMRHRALHDALTGLPNRTLVLDRVSHGLNRARQRGERTAALFVDIDRFKRINDTLGHHVGDQLLVEVARRLLAAVRPADTVARLGGDEFLVLCEDIGGVERATAVADQIAAALAMPMAVGDRQVNLTVSTGVAVATPEDTDPAGLVRDADLAMYRAKQTGRARVEVFDGAMRDEAAERLEIEEALHRAVADRELVVCYQPQVDLHTGAVSGAEALLRWQHPRWGTVYPDAFIPIAEDSGLIDEIGGWVLDEACQEAAALRGRVPDFVMSVNLSAHQLGRPDLVSIVQAALERSQLPAAALNLEITETILLDDQLSADAALRALRALGVGLSIDDFGTGYSSLSYLTRLPVQEVKIDRAFTFGLGREAGPSAIVGAVIAIARALGLRTVAEGVERQEQLELLRDMGCDAAQGWLWIGPQPARGFLSWLDDHLASPHPAH